MIKSKGLSAEVRGSVRGLLAILEAFRTIRREMPLQYLVSFLLVAEEEGLGVGEYAKRAGVSQSVMSRHLLDIGDRTRQMEKGMGLVTYRPNPLELRKHEYFLTDKGGAMLHQIARNWKREMKFG